MKNTLKFLHLVFFGTWFRTFNTVLTVATFTLCFRTGLLNIWCPVMGIYAIFTNLGSGSKKGELSAYSVLNKNFEKAIGSFKDEYRQHNPAYQDHKSKSSKKTFLDVSPEELAERSKEYFAKRNKFINKPCYCNSNLKYKKCCFKADMQSYMS